MSYSSCFCLLDRIIQICVSCFRAVQIWCFEYNSLILTTGCSTWHLVAKNSLRISEFELLLSTKMAEAIRSSVTAWNRVTVQWRGSYRGFPRRVSLGTGLAMVKQRSWILVKIVPCLQSTMVVVASWSGAAWVLLVLGSCGLLRETWIPTCTVTFWSRRLCPPFRNCAEQQFSNIITTPNTLPRWCWLADEAEGDGGAKHISRPEPYWAHVGHPQEEGGEAPCV